MVGVGDNALAAALTFLLEGKSRPCCGPVFFVAAAGVSG